MHSLNQDIEQRADETARVRAFNKLHRLQVRLESRRAHIEAQRRRHDREERADAWTVAAVFAFVVVLVLVVSALGAWGGQ